MAPPAGKTARRTSRQSADAKRSATASEPRGAARPRPGKTRAHSAEDTVGMALSAIRSSLARGLVLTGERLQETIDDAAKRGRLTHRDAEDLAQRLISVGRKQTDDLLRELEQIVGRGGDELIRASREFRKKLR